MNETSEKVASLVLDAMAANDAADEIEFNLMLHKAASSDIESLATLSGGVGLPDFSDAPIDPQKVYENLVEIVGEEQARAIMTKAAEDSIESELEALEGREPTQEQLFAALKAIGMEPIHGDDGGFDAEWGS